jgi:SPP1 family predicted phage head-tail adaptor
MTKFSRYNDGVVSIYREKVQRSTFGAKENTRTLDGLDFVCKLAYEEMSKRQQDQEFAEQNGFSLNVKIRTRFVNGVDSKCKAVIGDTLYDVSYIDKTRTELYLFLEEVRQLDT